MAMRFVRSAMRNAPSSSPSHFLRRRYSSECVPERKVTILGAAGGIGQPLALLMKINPLVSNLALYDIAGTPGVAADASHVNTIAQVRSSCWLVDELVSSLTLYLYLICVFGLIQLVSF